MLGVRLTQQLAEKYLHQYKHLAVSQDNFGNTIVDITWINGKTQKVKHTELHLLSPQGINEPDPE